MATRMQLKSSIGDALHGVANRVLPRLFIGIGVLLIHGAALTYVQAVEAEQVIGSPAAAVQATQCRGAHGGKLA